MWGVLGLRLYGKLIKERKIMREEVAINEDINLAFHDKLEKCLVEVSGKLDCPVPLWLEKNTKEFVSYRKTFFTSEQFMEKVWFDKLEIRIEE